MLHRFIGRSHFCALVVALLLAHGSVAAQTPAKGQRVFYSGHSFHYFMPPILAQMAKSAGIKDHTQVGLSAIGGSRVIQHWNVPEAKNKAKTALMSGKVDVFTMAPIFLPDEGIENFVKLALEHNPKIRILVQENWLPWDHYDPRFKAPKDKVDHNAPTVESLQRMHAPYFKSIEEHVTELNKKYETRAIHIAPVGQAVIALRTKILAGEAPGLKQQADLFYDAIGHAKAPLVALVGYCYYASIYLRSPVGLPLPEVLDYGNPEVQGKLNRVLQEIAWEAVTSHPMSGVKAVK